MDKQWLRILKRYARWHKAQRKIILAEIEWLRRLA